MLKRTRTCVHWAQTKPEACPELVEEFILSLSKGFVTGTQGCGRYGMRVLLSPKFLGVA